MLFFRLDIGIIPETYHLIFISEVNDRHRDIWTTTDMDEDFRFLSKFRTIESVFKDILGDFLRESRDDKLGIRGKKMEKISVLRNDFPNLSRGNIRDMCFTKKIQHEV
jgi:hypothetical protein